MIDIIIPAYNAHKTINKTLLSICMQTIKDKLNVYIIDDCSKEDYKKEVKEFSKIINIKTIKTKKNGGPGLARQFGMDSSNSKYIMFIDSDDTFGNMYSLEHLYKEAEEGEYDYVVGKMLQQVTSGIYEYESNMHPWCLHGKLYRRDFIKKYDIRFNNTSNNEDYAFNELVLLCEPKKKHVNEIVYCYMNNENSITRKDSEYEINTYDTYVYNMIWIFEEAKKRNVNIDKLSRFVVKALGDAYYLYCESFYSPKIDYIIEKTRELYPYYLEYKDNLSKDTCYDIFNSKFQGRLPFITNEEFFEKLEII